MTVREPPNAGGANVRRRAAGIGILLGTTNAAAWLWTLLLFSGQPVLLGTAALAYSLGLRHGLDVDHIAAIDNVTRKLMQEGKRPVTVGLFFALGHSAVVVLASIAIALLANAATERLVQLRVIGGIIGTAASALFLLAIALANVRVLRGVYRALRQVRSGRDLPTEDLDVLLRQRGGIARLFRPLFGFVSRSWHMFPVGLLFALGFETASEISLFGLAAQASSAISPWSMLVFPSLFAAAMTLVDTADGILMLGAYGWAYVNPVRKLLYNLTITSVSVLVALTIGSIEALGLLAEQLALEGPVWRASVAFTASFAGLGYLIVALFVASWAASAVIHRLWRQDRRDA
jgi:high-affinity nickel-transport protein